MVEPVLDLFKIHRKMILGNPAIIVQNMFRIAPKPFNAVDMIFAFVGKCLAVMQPMVLAPALQRVVAPKGVGVVHGPFSGMRSDMGHKLISGHLFHNLGIHSAIALQKPEYDAFSGCAPSALALPPAAKVRLVNFNLALQFACLKLRHMVDRLAQALVDTGHCLIVHAEIDGYAVGRLLLVKAGQDRNLFSQLLQGLLFPACRSAALYIPTTSLAHLERPAEHALSAPQKVGRTVENVLLSCNHKGILALDGYESN